MALHFFERYKDKRMASAWSRKIWLVMFLILLSFITLVIKTAQGQHMCNSQSLNFKGYCTNDPNCNRVCQTTLLSPGHCIFQPTLRKCYCYCLNKNSWVQYNNPKKIITTELKTNMEATDAIPPALNSNSEPPPLFDGTTRLYISVICPYAQRVWAAINYKGLNDIQIVAIDLQDKPTWYKEKVYPLNKVPTLEHNGKVIGESLVLLEYLDNNFDGPKLIPTDAAKKETANELLEFSNTFNKIGFMGLTKPEPEVAEAIGSTLDYLENALGKFSDGPFFLGEFSLIDLVYAPFAERFKIVYPILKNCNITTGRPKLLKWIQW